MKSTYRTQRGFTLLEIMLVVAIIVCLLAAAIKFMAPDLGVAQTVRVQADIQSITTQLRTYQALNGFLPTTEQGLQALVTRPDSDPKPTQWHLLMDAVPLDPWNNPYIYEYPGKHNPNSFDLYSAGASRKPGTGTDIGNWDDNASK